MYATHLSLNITEFYQNISIWVFIPFYIDKAAVVMCAVGVKPHIDLSCCGQPLVPVTPCTRKVRIPQEEDAPF